MIYLKIGKKIGDLLNIRLSDRYLDEIGKYVCSKYDCSPQLVYNLIKRDVAHAIPFVLDKIYMQNSIKSKTLFKVRKSAALSYRFFALCGNDSSNFDLFNNFESNCFATITNVESCGASAGRELMKEFLEDISGYPVIVQMSVPNGIEDRDEYLEKLIHVFSSIGFEGYPHESIPNVMVHWNGYKKPNLEKCDVFN